LKQDLALAQAAVDDLARSSRDLTFCFTTRPNSTEFVILALARLWKQKGENPSSSQTVQEGYIPASAVRDVDFSYEVATAASAPDLALYALKKSASFAISSLICMARRIPAR
jgi:hypothetical protein